MFFLAAEDGGGSFLVSPSAGLMIWTLIAFGITAYILNKVAFPRIAEALDKRLKEAREQAEDIVVRARKAADSLQDESKQAAVKQREELLEQTRRDIEAETKRALDEIRKEVASLTVAATEKVTRKSLDSDDHRRLIEEALQEVDFSALSGEGNGSK